MATFLWSGKDVEGHERSERVEAENAQDAKKILLGRGWTSLELIKDEIGDSVALQVEAADCLRDSMDEDHTPEKEAAYFKGKRAPGLFGQTCAGIKEFYKGILFFIVVLAWGIYCDWALAYIGGAVGVVFCVLFTPVLYLVFSFFARTRKEYSQLNQAKVWGRWEEVLECVEELRNADKLTGAAVPELELARNRAQALAALGRMEEGLAEYQQWENSPKLEHWLYLSFLGGIYDAGREFENGLEARRQAAAEKPDMSSVWIDVAYAAVRRLNRPAEAREALVRAEKLEITGMGKPYLFFLKGIIYWRERQPAEAKKHLTRALAGFQPMAHHDLVQGLLFLTKSYLCAVNGQLANTSEARKLFVEVEPFLTANREDELLQACRTNLPGR